MLRKTPLDPSVTYRPHVGPTRQYMRDIILGVNDGLVSIFLLVVGVVGGGLTSQQILLAGVAASIAGAVSMASGEYIATKSQEQVFDREMELEKEHLLSTGMSNARRSGTCSATWGSLPRTPNESSRSWMPTTRPS